MVWFIVFFGVIVLISEQFQFLTTIAFVVGAFCSLLSGYIGMNIATKANMRVTYQASMEKKDEALSEAFTIAFRGGCVMGFCLVSIALFSLTVMIMIYMLILTPESGDNIQFLRLFEFISGYGLGGSTVALFCRVGGGIYTKAADVGADLVGKVIMHMNEDSPENPATIADNVGDNVGDIAGMGADLFGSFSESTCAALIVSGTSTELIAGSAFLFPLILSGAGIIVSIITSFFAISFMKVDKMDKIEQTLKWQLLISSIILTPTIIILCIYFLPENINFEIGKDIVSIISTTNFGIIVCILSGLYSGLLIGFLTDYYTSNNHEYSIYLDQSRHLLELVKTVQLSTSFMDLL